MIPDAATISAGADLVNSAFTEYTVLPLVLGIVFLPWAGTYVLNHIKRVFGR